jgi:hypothetical protein
MDYVGFALPILPGQAGAARAFQRELERERKEDYAASERAIGIAKELWFVQETPNGDLFVAYMESPDFARALGRFAASPEPFDVWFKEQLVAATGVNLNDPPPGPLSELVSHYEAA